MIWINLFILVLVISLITVTKFIIKQQKEEIEAFKLAIETDRSHLIRLMEELRKKDPETIDQISASSTHIQMNYGKEEG